MLIFIRLELKRAFTSKGMIAALIFGAVVTIHFFVTHTLSEISMMQYALPNKIASHNAVLPDQIWMEWLALFPYSFHSSLLFTLAPFLAGLPHAASLLQDQRDGYLNVGCTRGKRTSYLVGKCVAAFLSGGFVILFPFILHFLILLTIYPFMAPIPGSGHQVIYILAMLANLSVNAPIIWLLIWLLIFFIVGGIFAICGLAVSFITEYVAVVRVLPFLLFYVTTALLSVFNLSIYSPTVLMDPARNTGASFFILVVEYGLIFLVSVLPLLRLRKGDLL